MWEGAVSCEGRNDLLVACSEIIAGEPSRYLRADIFRTNSNQNTDKDKHYQIL